MDGYPISISEAARRLDVPIGTASILVRAFEIPTTDVPCNGMAKGLDRAGFLKLQARSLAFKRSRELESAAG